MADESDKATGKEPAPASGKGNPDSGTAELDELRQRMLDQVELINRTWLDRWRDIHSFEMDIGAKLLATKDPEEALAICNDWMAKRIEAFAADHQRFTKLWFELLATAMHANEEKK